MLSKISITQRLSNTKHFHDKRLWGLFLGLCVLSAVEVFSASSGLVTSEKTIYQILFKHLLFLSLGGGIVWLVGECFPTKWLKFFGVVGAFIGLLFLIYTFFGGVKINDARRWINIFGIQLQPSEFNKAFYIAAIAFFIVLWRKISKWYWKAFIVTLYILLPIFFIAIPNGSMGIMYVLITLAMFWYADLLPSLRSIFQHKIGRWFGGVALVLMIAGTLFISYAYTTRNDGPSIYVDDRYESEILAQERSERDDSTKQASSFRFSTWKARFSNHFRDYPVDANHLDINDQTSQEIHSRLAIASSKRGLGLFFGNSKQRDYLSLAYSDLIFAIIIEEAGLPGAFLVLLIYALLIIHCGTIAKQCTTDYHTYIALGIGTSLAIQVLVNTFVAVGIIPITGQTLPIISHGGSSILSTSLLIGVLMCISRYNRRRMAYEASLSTPKSPRATEQALAQEAAETIMPAPPLEG